MNKTEKSYSKARTLYPKAGEALKVYFRQNGEAIQLEACCDCHLIHLNSYKPAKRYLSIRSWRDEDRTKFFRKKARKK